MTQILLILILEAIGLTIAWRKGLCFIEGFVAINLIAVQMTSQVNSDFGFGISNAGNLFYAPILSVMVLIYAKWSKTKFIETLFLTLFIAVGLIALRFCAIAFNTVNPDAPITLAYKLVVDSMIQTFLGSLTAFASASVLIALGFEYLKQLPAWAKYLLILPFAELLDSFVFFFLLFEDFSKFTNFFWVGFMAKCLIHLLFFPVFVYLIRNEPIECCEA